MNRGQQGWILVLRLNDHNISEHSLHPSTLNSVLSKGEGITHTQIESSRDDPAPSGTKKGVSWQ